MQGWMDCISQDARVWQVNATQQCDTLVPYCRWLVLTSSEVLCS
jgi:hypothetical protein